MGQKTTGWRRALSSPTVYETVQRLLRSDRVRTHLLSCIDARPGDRILDIGCGTGLVLDWVDDVSYIGFDISESYIERARAKYGSRATFHVGGVDDIDPAEIGTPDIVLAKAVLHHISDEQASKVMRIASSVLADGGRLVTFDPVYTPEQSRLARFVIERDRGQHIRALDDYVAIAREHFLDVRADVRGDLLRVPYTHLVLQCAGPT